MQNGYIFNLATVIVLKIHSTSHICTFEHGCFQSLTIFLSILSLSLSISALPLSLT